MYVHDILVRDGDKVWLFGERLSTCGFSSHFHAWVVTDCSNEFIAIPAEFSVYPFPVAICDMASENTVKFVGLKYRV
jgi:hypothetical protein